MLPINQETNVVQIKNFLTKNLSSFIPDIEIAYKAELISEINQLKEEKNAIILGHNYMEAALYHTVSDFRGDSLELSRKAAETHADVIVFCGVKFMAETAKILSPLKKVLLPSLKAGCSLAASITVHDVRELKKKYPGAPVVTYVNTYADVKAETDICVTSSNAARVVASLIEDTIIFLPDEYLARNVAKETGKNIIFYEQKKLEKNSLISWHGKCEVHEKFSVDDIAMVRKQFPDVLVLAHPECSPEVVSAADFSGSTSRMIDYVAKSNAPRFLLLTECAMGDNIVASFPDKELIRLCNIRCPHMAQITLEDTRNALKLGQYEIDVEPTVAEKARKSLLRMLEF